MTEQRGGIHFSVAVRISLSLFLSVSLSVCLCVSVTAAGLATKARTIEQRAQSALDREK